MMMSKVSKAVGSLDALQEQRRQAFPSRVQGFTRFHSGSATHVEAQSRWLTLEFLVEHQAWELMSLRR
jgi:hypothetical protein